MDKRIVIGIILILGLSACSGEDDAPGGKVAVDGNAAVARVGELLITEADIDAEFEAMPAQFRKLKDNPAMRANLLNNMLDRYAILKKGEQMGIKDDPAVRYRIESNEAAIVRQELERLRQSRSPDDSEVKAYYDANRQRFNLPERVHVRHLLVKEETEAGKLLARLKKGGDFSKLASAYSIDMSSKGRGGELPPFTQGMMEPTFSEAAFSLHKKNALSGVVKSPFGYHIIQLIERFPAGEQSLDEARSQIEQEMRIQDAQAWMGKIRAEVEAEVLKPSYRLPGAVAGGGN